MSLVLACKQAGVVTGCNFQILASQSQPGGSILFTFIDRFRAQCVMSCTSGAEWNIVPHRISASLQTAEHHFMNNQRNSMCVSRTGLCTGPAFLTLNLFCQLQDTWYPKVVSKTTFLWSVLCCCGLLRSMAQQLSILLLCDG